jgi:hypothetical protein
VRVARKQVRSQRRFRDDTANEKWGAVRLPIFILRIVALRRCAGVVMVVAGAMLADMAVV